MPGKFEEGEIDARETGILKTCFFFFIHFHENLKERVSLIKVDTSQILNSYTEKRGIHKNEQNWGKCSYILSLYVCLYLRLYPTCKRTYDTVNLDLSASNRIIDASYNRRHIWSMLSGFNHFISLCLISMTHQCNEHLVT